MPLHLNLLAAIKECISRRAPTKREATAFETCVKMIAIARKFEILSSFSAKRFN